MAYTASQSASEAIAVYALDSDVQALSTHFGTELGKIHAMLNGELVDLSQLDTAAQDNLVNAINELKAQLDAAIIGGGGTTTTDTDYAASFNSNIP